MIEYKYLSPVQLTRNWFNSTLAEMKRKKIWMCNRAKLSNNLFMWAEYRSFRNEYTLAIKSAKNNYIKRKIQQPSNQKTMWQNIKTLVLKKERPEIEKIKVDGETVINKCDMAKKLNNYFVKSIEEINCDIPNRQYEDQIPTCDTNFKFTAINFSKLKDTLRNMNNKKDYNLISAKMLLGALNEIGPVFINAINSSLRTGVFPEAWKESLVVPVPKIDNPVKAEDLRPINTLPIESKVMGTRTAKWSFRKKQINIGVSIWLQKPTQLRGIA